MSLNDGYEQSVLDYIFGAGSNGLAPASWWLGLSSADPTESGGFMAEPTGMGYARVEIPNNSSYFSAASGSNPTQKTNLVALDFLPATGNWGVLTHWALFSSNIATVPKVYGALSPSKAIQSGDVLRIPGGGMIITAD